MDSRFEYRDILEPKRTRKRWVRTYRGDRHLASAICDSYIRRLLSTDKEKIPRHVREPWELVELWDHKYANIERGIQGWKCIYDIFYTRSPHAKTLHSNRDFMIAAEMLKNSLAHHSKIERDRLEEIDSLVAKMTHSTILVPYLNARVEIERVRKKVGRSSKIYMIESVNNVVFKFLDESVCFMCPKCGMMHVEPYSSFLCAQDTLCGRLSTLIFALVRDSMRGADDTLGEVVRTFYHMDQILEHYQVKAYAIFKCLPSLATAAILRDHDPIDDGDFLTSLLDGIREEGINTNQEDIEYFSRKTTSKNEQHLLIECSGLWKMCGHPVVDIGGGAIKIVKKGGVPKTGLKDISKMISSAFKATFCREYFRKIGKWPECDVSKCPHEIVKNHHLSSWNENPNLTWPISYFDNLVFKKTFDFDYHPDISELLSDTSICGGLSQWHYEIPYHWVHEVQHGYPMNRRLPRTNPSKVILDFMKRKYIDLKTIIDLIDNQDIPEEWKIIVLVAKERELKEFARMFAKCHSDIRFWQISTEKAIASNILKFLRYQSMTMTDDVLQSRLITMSGCMKKRNEISHVVVVVDFSSWNLQFRIETVHDLLKDLDLLHGFRNVFSYTHLFPMESTIIIRDPGNVPRENMETGRPLIGPRCLVGHESFFEGMRQKGWTLYTICLILITSISLRYKIDLLGQGDNQAILIEIPTGLRRNVRRVKEYVDRFCLYLREICNEAQIPIRLDETWRSSILFEYSRISFLNGAQVSQALKKASRISSESNNMISSLAADVASIFSSGISVATVDKTPIAAYFLTIFEALQVLRVNAEKIYHGDAAYLQVLLSMTRIIGGFPIANYSSFCIRGNPDPLTENISYIKYLWENVTNLRPWIRALLRLEPTTYRDIVLLIQDPVCLSLKIPNRSENYLRETLRKTVKDSSCNIMIQALFSSTAQDQKQKLVNDLSLISPRNPRVLNCLYNLSNVGLQERMIGRFSSPLTIVQLATNEITDYISLWNVIEEYDNIMITFYLLSPDHRTEITFSTLVYNPSNCSTVIADNLRFLHWGNLYGVTMPSPTEQITVYNWDSTDNLDGDAIKVRLFNDSKDTLITRGPTFPFIGSDTQEKIKKPPLSLSGTTSLTRAAFRITALTSWIGRGEDPNLLALLQQISDEKNTLTTDELKEASGRVCGGSMYHRLNDMATDHGARVNSTSTFGSHLMITTDTLTSMARLSPDKTVFFQHIKAYLVSLFRHWVIFGIIKKGDFAVRLTCNTCTRDIVEEDLKMLSSPTYVGVQLPIPIGTLTVKYRGLTITHEQPESPQHLLSLAMARLSAQFLTSADSSMINDIAGITSASSKCLNLSDLAMCDPKTFTFYLLSYLPTFVFNFAYIPQSVVGIVADTNAVNMGIFPSLVRSLFASGLLERIYKAFSYRSPDPKWCTSDRNMVKSFYSFLLLKSRTIELTDFLKNPIATQLDSAAHINRLRLLFNKEVIITRDPDSLIALYRKTFPVLLEGEDSWHEQCLGLGLGQILTHVGLPDRRNLTTLGRVFPYRSLHGLTRTFGSESTSICKFLELFTTFKIPLLGDTIMTLAEGDGGVASYLLHVLRDHKLIFNTLLSMTDTRSHAVLELPSSLYADPCFSTNRLLNWNYLRSGSTDLTDLECIAKLVKVAEYRDVTVLTVDINVIEDYKTLFEHLEVLIISVKPRIFYIKVMIKSVNFEIFPNLCDLYKISGYLCSSSNQWTGEIYLIGEEGKSCTHTSTSEWNDRYEQWSHLLKRDQRRAEEVAIQTGKSILRATQHYNCQSWLKNQLERWDIPWRGCLVRGLSKVLREHIFWVGSMSWERASQISPKLFLGRTSFSSVERIKSLRDITYEITVLNIWIAILKRTKKPLSQVLQEREEEDKIPVRWHVDLNKDKVPFKMSLCQKELCPQKRTPWFVFFPSEIVSKTIGPICKLFTYQSLTDWYLGELEYD